MKITFSHNHLDKFKLSGYPEYFTHLRRELNLSRSALGNLIGISHETVRRYENHYNAAPRWYEYLMRFLNGDLSAFGNYWQDCRIHTNSDNKLATPYDLYMRYTPMDINIKHSLIAHQKDNEIMNLKNELNDLLSRYNRLLVEHQTIIEKLRQLELLEHQRQALKDGLKSGKVVPFRTIK